MIAGAKLRRSAIFIHDALWVPVAIWCAYWVRYNLGSIPSSDYSGAFIFASFALPVHMLSFWVFGCYRGIWRFASIPDLVRLLKAVGVGVLVTTVALLMYNRFESIPRSVPFIYPVVLFLGVSFSRVFYRLIKDQRVSLSKSEQVPTLVVGAGRAASMLLRDLKNHFGVLVVGVLDDDPAKQGQELHGVRIVGTISELKSLVMALDVESVIVAMPSAPRRVMRDVVETCSEMKVDCRTLPSLLELADGRVEVSSLRSVTVEDLLGREPVSLDEDAIDSYLTCKSVVVTGAGGSIGSELCRQILAHKPSRLVLVESSEFNLYQIEQELSKMHQSTKLIAALADVRLEESINNIFGKYKPDVVFHAAAYKHVPIVEENVVPGIRNNVMGTRIVANAAVKHKVSTFVLVSTDKTVNPTNVMGATKRMAEIYCQALNERVETHFITTRFGNVLGSAGSVVPLFQKQIAAGGPITVTHPEITRFFMTIPEAASLILQAGAMGKGGEIFVLDMGQPVKIKDLAENLIRLSGLQPEVDIKIEYVGLRAGEKMHEELFYDKEELVGTGHPKLMLANCATCTWDRIESDMPTLDAAVASYDEKAALALIQQFVPEFKRYVPENRGQSQEQEVDQLTTNPGMRIIK